MHGFLPSDLTDTVLVPIVKDKTGDISDKGNYRPIALASVISKVLEMALLVKLEKHLYSSDYQFGFKPTLYRSITAAVAEWLASRTR